MSKLSLENFENGVQVFQDEDMYKFTCDAIRLAKFATIKPHETVLDMCAGCGVVGLYAYSLTQFKNIYFNDIQPQMCELIEKNIIHNNLQEKAKVLCKNLADLCVKDFDNKIDIVLCNPPYFKVNNGKNNSDESISLCRHEITATLSEIVCKAGQLLSTKGRFYVVIPSERLCELIIYFQQNKFEAKRIGLFGDKNVKISVVEGVKDAKSGVKIQMCKD